MFLLFSNGDGSVARVFPAPEYEGTLEYLATLSVPVDAPWRIVSVLPEGPQEVWVWSEVDNDAD